MGGDLKVEAFKEEVKIVEALFLVFEKHIVGNEN